MGENEEELVALYSTLVDEDNFDLSEDEICSPKVGFLEEVEKQLAERGEKQREVKCLETLKSKILEAVKNKKLTRRSRLDSFSSSRRDSVGSNSSVKRGQKDQNGTDSSRAKLETQ